MLDTAFSLFSVRFFCFAIDTNWVGRHSLFFIKQHWVLEVFYFFTVLDKQSQGIQVMPTREHAGITLDGVCNFSFLAV